MMGSDKRREAPRAVGRIDVNLRRIPLHLLIARHGLEVAGDNEPPGNSRRIPAWVTDLII